MVSNRDFSLFCHVIHLLDGNKINIIFSRDHSKIPEESGIVRALIEVSMTYIKEISSSKISMTQIVRTDLWGSLPTSIINAATGALYNDYVNLKKVLES